MRKRRPGGPTSALLGLAAGLLLGIVLFQRTGNPGPAAAPPVRSSTSSLVDHQEPSPPPSSAKSGFVLDAPPDPRREPTDQVGGLLFVGVMTARKYLDTRAKAVYETWGREVPGRMAFYSSEFSESADLPLHPLPRVDDSYPPQKKSFLMLQHMYLNYGHLYEWFLRADDDLYVRMDRLETLLRSVDSTKPKYIGQAGRGNSEEFGLLSLEYDENFCMGGPGVLFSRETLRMILPHIKFCLANLYTTHEDVELGRCVRKFAGISCTWSYEMQSILYHNSSGDLAFTGRLKTKEVHRAISMHPVKSPPHMYRLHNYMRGLKIQELQNKKIELQRDIKVMKKSYDESLRGVGRESATGKKMSWFEEDDEDDEEDEKCRRKGVEEKDLIKEGRIKEWDFVSRSEYSLGDSNPRRRLHAEVREGLEDAVREVMASINACSRQRGRLVEERQALYGYRSRGSANDRGLDTILDLLLIYKKYRGKKVTLPVRRHLYLHQHFTGLEIRELGSGPKRKRVSDPRRMTDRSDEEEEEQDQEEKVGEEEVKLVNFIVPVSGRHSALKRFVKNYEQVFLLNGRELEGQANDEKTRLIIVLYSEEADGDAPEGTAARMELKESSELVERLEAKYGEQRIKLVRGRGKFSRARALDQGANLLRADELIFFVDVDIQLNSRAVLHRIRSNTARSKSVYFPVVFSQYDPRVVRQTLEADSDSTSEMSQISELTGFWRIFGFGIVAIYKSDYDSIGGLDLGIEGWGKEDVDLFEKALRHSSAGLDLRVFRAPDIDLVHVYHGVVCDATAFQSLNQLHMCKGTRADTYASTQQLASFIYSDPRYLNFSVTAARLKQPQHQ